MKKKYSIMAFILVIVLGTLACSITIPSIDIGYSSVRGTGDVMEEQRSVDGIRAVSVANQGDLYISLGDKEALVIEAEENLLEYIESDVRGGELVLETQNGVNLRNSEPIKYYLTVVELDEVTVNSSGSIDAPKFNVDQFSVNVNSSGDVAIEGLDVEKLEVGISSSGDVSIGTVAADDVDVRISSSGNVLVAIMNADILDVNISSSGSLTIQDGGIESQDISISSSGDYEAKDLPSLVAEVRISSSGTATIRVRDELDARLSSSGDLYYIGNPALNVRTSSSGDVIQLGQ